MIKMKEENFYMRAKLISEKVDEKREEIIEFCRDLIKIPSVSGEEKEIQEFIANHLKKLGLEVHVWEPDLLKLQGHPDYVKTEKGYVGRPNVVAICKGNGKGRSLILNGHSDVVSPEPLVKWSCSPWGAQVLNGKIYGRGACDMKGGIAGMIKALEILLELNLTPPGDIIIEVVVDEETGGNGTLASILEGYNAEGAIFCEPTCCKIMPAHRGASFWKLVVEGKGAHGGVMHKGISAIDKSIILYKAIQELKKTRNEKGNEHPLYRIYPDPAPLCVGKIHGGEWPSAVPEECILEGLIEFLPGERMEEIKEEFEKVVKDVAEKDPWLKNHPPRLEWVGLNFPPAEISSDHILVKTFREAYAGIFNQEVELVGFPAGCDMRLRMLITKTPSIIFGPGDISFAHRVDEFIEIDDLISFTKILALGILEWSEK